MKIERENKPAVIIGNRIPLGLAIGSAVAWFFWLGDTYWWDVKVPTAMITQMTSLIVFFAQIWWVNKFGVTT